MNRKINEILNSDRFFHVSLVVLVFLFLLRGFGVDKDLPAYGIGAFNPTDEGLYGGMAINLHEYGSFLPKINLTEDIIVVPYTAYHIRTNILENLMVYVGLSAFGDNYYGFRLPMVFVSFINYLLILWISHQLIVQYSQNEKADRWLLVLIGLLYAFSFPFLIASRVVEPTMMRMTFGLLAFAAFLFIKNDVARYFWAGFLIATSLQLVYITNVFFCLAIAGAIGINLFGKGWRIAARECIGCVFGGLCSLGICACYYALVWKDNFISNSLHIFSDFGNVPGYTSAGTGGFKAFVATVLDFWGSNTFLFHFPILILFLLMVPQMMIVFFRKKDDIPVFSFLAVIGLFLQTLFSNDYVFRKAYLIMPFVIFCMLILCADREIKLSMSGVLSYGYIAAIVSLTILIIYYRFFTFRVGTANDFPLLLKGGIIAVAGISALGISFGIIGKDTKRRLWVCGSVIAASFALNMVCGVVYVWLNDQYTEKEAMLELRDHNGSPIFGAYSYGFALYNDIQPILLKNEEIWDLIKEYDDYAFIDVSTSVGDYVRTYLDYDSFLNSRYTGVKENEIIRSWNVDGKEMIFALYGIGLKTNVSLENEMKEKGVFWTKSQSRKLKEAAIKKYQIEEKYRSLLINTSKKEQYQIQMDLNNEIDLLYRKMELSDEDVNLLNSTVTGDSIPMLLNGTSQSVFGSVTGDIYGDVNYPIYGDVYGSIYGNVNAEIYGNIYGEIYGNNNVEGDER